MTKNAIRAPRVIGGLSARNVPGGLVYKLVLDTVSVLGADLMAELAGAIATLTKIQMHGCLLRLYRDIRQKLLVEILMEKT